MSFLNAVKGAIWNEDPSERKSQTPPQPTKAAAPAGTTPAIQPISFNTSVNSEMVEALRAVIQGRKTAFTALDEQAAKLESIIPDVVTRMRAAFATVNRPAKDVIQAIDIHISDINGEVMKFKSHSTAEKAGQVGTLRAQAKALVDSAPSITAQIQELEAKATQLREQLTINATKANDLNAQADTAESKFTTAEVAFEASAKSIITELETQKQSFLSTIGENK